MANAILWDAHPSAETLIAADGALKNLANAAIAASAECANGTGLFTEADFELYLHDFAVAPCLRVAARPLTYQHQSSGRIMCDWSIFWTVIGIAIPALATVGGGAWLVARSQGRVSERLSEIHAQLHEFSKSLEKAWQKLDGMTCQAHATKIEEHERRLNDHEQRIRKIEV